MKVVGIVIVCIVAAVVLIVPITGAVAKLGIKNRDKPWAAGCVYKSAGIRVRLMQYRSGKRMLERGLEVFPRYKNADRARFLVAYCCEKMKDTDGALAGYRAFLAAAPSHDWADRAKRKIQTIESERIQE